MGHSQTELDSSLDSPSRELSFGVSWRRYILQVPTIFWSACWDCLDGLPTVYGGCLDNTAVCLGA